MSIDTNTVIKQIRSRAQAHHEYLSKGERETRTKYALIDPILRSLGWDTEHPTQVRLEYEVDHGNNGTGIVDYALFNDSGSKPYILIEAKGLEEKNAENAKALRDRLREKEADRAEMFKLFAGGAGLAAFDDSGMTAKYEDGGMFPGMRKRHLAQLSGYTRAFEMDQGFGVLTNGDEWEIYDMSLSGEIDQKQIASISLLRVEDSIYDCVNALNILKRES